MFNFFKKLFNNDSNDSKSKQLEVDKQELNDDEIKEVVNQIDELKYEAQKYIESQNKEELSKCYEAIGNKYESIENDKKAILYYEKSIETYPNISEGYKRLLMIYNRQRAEAAKNNNQNEMQYYMVKLDELRNVGKNITVIRK